MTVCLQSDRLLWVRLSYRCLSNHQASLQSVNYRLRKWGQCRGRFWLRNKRLYVCGLAVKLGQTQPPDMPQTYTVGKHWVWGERGGTWRCCPNSVLCPCANRACVTGSHGRVCMLALASGLWPRRSPRAKFYGHGVFFVWLVVLCILLIDC